MRKEAMVENNVTLSAVQQYHADSHGNYTHDESYTFLGFVENLYFNSDRAIKLDENYQRADGQPFAAYGVEIETECWSVKNHSVLAEILTQIVLEKFGAGSRMFKLQRDGSLGTDNAIGVEIITQCWTKARFRNEYKNFKTMYDTYFKNMQISCSRTGHCGMHVNISNANFGKTKKIQDESIRKLYYVINRHFELCRKAFLRGSDTGYCGRMDYSNARTLNLSAYGSNHYCCFNLGHYNTGRVEIRLPGGQPTYGAFRNTMETVFFLVERMKSLKWEQLDDIATVFSGCNQYVYDRLESKCDLPLSTLQDIKRNVVTEALL